MLDIWTVYDHPLDYPDGFIARKFVLDKPTECVVTARTLEEVRCAIPPGLHRMDRHPADDAAIVETWF